jgi:hypothetical protein
VRLEEAGKLGGKNLDDYHSLLFKESWVWGCIQEAEAGESQVLGPPRLYGMTLSQTTKRKTLLLRRGYIRKRKGWAGKEKKGRNRFNVSHFDLNAYGIHKKLVEWAGRSAAWHSERALN